MSDDVADLSDNFLSMPYLQARSQDFGLGGFSPYESRQ